MHKHLPEDDPWYPRAPECTFPTKKACDNHFANWQAAQQVSLAHAVIRAGRQAAFRRDDTVFGQLVRVILGDKETITAGDGEASRAAFTRRVLAMLERYREEHPAEQQEAEMPVDANGRWESWDARKDRERAAKNAALAAAEAEAPEVANEEESLTAGQKAARTRAANKASKAAAEAAIADATGVEVNIDTDVVDESTIDDSETIDEEQSE